MKKTKLRHITILGLACLSGALLLHTSQNVQRSEEKLAGIEASTKKEQETIRVLKAEWAYLNSPQRLEVLASEYLGLVAPSSDYIVPDSSVFQERSMPSGQEENFQPISQSAVYVAPARKPEGR